jgi:5-methylcytosine-specific restriction enzyme A
MSEFPYNTANWQRLRKLKLNVNTLCEMCFPRGRLEPAVHVDHIVAIKDGGEAFPPLDGLMSLCLPCHNEKTFGKRDVFKGCGADGLPLDQSHPFYGKERSQLRAWHSDGHPPLRRKNR